ncbi:MAG: hypothetical protein BJ554DRAFT_2068, partial [Olpidium bornovanus]
ANDDQFFSHDVAAIEDGAQDRCAVSWKALVADEPGTQTVTQDEPGHLSPVLKLTVGRKENHENLRAEPYKESVSRVSELKGAMVPDAESSVASQAWLSRAVELSPAAPERGRQLRIMGAGSISEQIDGGSM